MTRFAVVHDWFDCIAGSEKVVKEMMHCYNDADVFSLVDHLSEAERESLGIAHINTSFIQTLPFHKSKFRNYLPLMPIAVEQFNLSNYDVILSSSHAFAKGIVTSAEQIHLSYVHTPIRYAWDMQHEYLEQQGLNGTRIYTPRGIKSLLVRSALHYIRMWDRSTADRVDVYIANSGYVANRIKKTYNRDAHVIYPPCDVHKMNVRRTKEDFFLAAGRLVPYKRFDLIVEAMKHLPDQKLIVIGDGSEMKKLKSLAGDNVEFLGYQSDEVLYDHMERAKAFVFGAIEDFGIMPVEAQACGTPVVAMSRGGTAETVQHKNTGYHFDDQTPECIADAMQVVADLPRGYFDADHIRAHAETFGRDKFRENFQSLVESTIAAKKQAYGKRQPILIPCVETGSGASDSLTTA